MRERRRRLLPLLVLAVLLLMPAGAAAARDWWIPWTGIALALGPDGTIAVSELRVFRFDGEYTHLYQEIEFPARSKLLDLVLTDGDGTPLVEQGGKAPGTYTVTRTEDGARVDWYFAPGAREETFVLTYWINNALRIHDDGAELYWDLIGAEWSRGTDRVEITVDLPAPPLDAWAEGGKMAGDGASFTISADRLAAKTAVSVRAFLPLSAVPESRQESDGESVQKLLVRAGRARDPVSRAIHAAWLIFALAYGIQFYFRHVRRPPPLSAPGPDETPQPLPLAVLARFMQIPMRDGLRAALIDLVQRGAIRVERVGVADWLFTRTEADLLLTSPEYDLLEAFFPPGRRQISLSEWKEQRVGTTHARKLLDRWWKEADAAVPAYYLARTDLWFLLVVIAGGVLLVAGGPDPLRPWGVGADAALLILGFCQPRLTPEGDRQLTLWRRVRESLKSPAESLLPLAVAVGLTPDLSGLSLSWVDDTFIVLRTALDRSSGGGDGGSDGGGGDGGDGGGDGGGGGDGE